MREVLDQDELAVLCAGDTLCAWAAQGLDGRSQVWANDGGAVAIVAAGLFLRDRLVVRGPVAAAATLAEKVLAELASTYQVLGTPEIVEAVVAANPELVPRNSWLGWMDCVTLNTEPAASKAAWLTEAELREVTDLLQTDAPGSFAKPGVPGVQRWAGIRDETGRLRAVAALGWSAPTVGMVTGVATSASYRGHGLGRQICGFVLAQALREYGAAALMVHDANIAARTVYERLGMRYRAISTAARG